MSCFLAHYNTVVVLQFCTGLASQFYRTAHALRHVSTARGLHHTFIIPHTCCVLFARLRTRLSNFHCRRGPASHFYRTAHILCPVPWHSTIGSSYQSVARDLVSCHAVMAQRTSVLSPFDVGCTCVHVWVCGCVGVRVCVHVCACACVHMCVRACVHVCMFACVRVCVCVHVHACVCMHLRVCPCVRVSTCPCVRGCV